IVFGIALVAARGFRIGIPGIALLALQCAVAAGLARLRRLPFWWLWLEAGFPVAVAAMAALRIPSGIFLAAFIVSAALYWTTFRTQVPYYPSGRAVWDAVAAQLPREQPIRFLDAGSGMGGMVMHLAAGRDGIWHGAEAAPLPCFASAVLARWRGLDCRFFWKRYQRIDFADYDVVFAYLSPAAMPGIWEQVRREVAPGSLFLSYEFPVSGVAPDAVIPVGKAGVPLHVWRL
ncbi:MAG: class I SAM-dependent methyltransferase, partial [Burkholderiaceae bacterium]